MGGDIYNALGGSFNPDEYEKQEEFTLIPTGWYPAEIEEAEVKDTKAGTGKYLKLRFCILGDSHGGRKIYKNMNIKNPNQDAEKIGLRELATMVEAVKVVGLESTAQLIGKTLNIHVVTQKSKNPEFPDDNDVNQFKSLGGTAPAKKERTSAPPTAQAEDVPDAASKQHQTTKQDTGKKPPPWMVRK